MEESGLKEREEWLADTEKFFQQVKSYNTTIISIGYATIFGCLLFLSGKTDSPLLFWAILALVVSAAIFTSYEVFNTIRMANACRIAGKEGKRFFRRWICFFGPSLFLAVASLAVLVVLVLCELA